MCLDIKRNEKEYPIEKDVFYINKGICPTNLTNVKLLKTINWKDENPAVEMMEYTGKNSMVDLTPGVPSNIH